MEKIPFSILQAFAMENGELPCAKSFLHKRIKETHSTECAQCNGATPEYRIVHPASRRIVPIDRFHLLAWALRVTPLQRSSQSPDRGAACSASNGTNPVARLPRASAAAPRDWRPPGLDPNFMGRPDCESCQSQPWDRKLQPRNRERGDNKIQLS
jgi:hypothetical protein